MSVLAKAARGETVDGEALRKAVAKAMEIFITRLDDQHSEQTKSNLQHALQSLKSEFVIFLKK